MMNFTKAFTFLPSPKRLRNILARIRRGTPDECWPYDGATRSRRSPYGVVVIAGKKWQVTHLIYLLFRGPLPDGKFVCHSCDYPPCCNERHLWAGTHDDNMADRTAKNRQAQGLTHGRHTMPERTARGDANGARRHPERLRRGETVHGSRLTAAVVAEIKSLLRQLRPVWTRAKGSRAALSQTDIADRYGVALSTISAIKCGKTWRHIT
mgnify:CR=1 FL=1